MMADSTRQEESFIHPDSLVTTLVTKNVLTELRL